MQNIIDIETLKKISKDCEIDLETTNLNIYTLGSNNPLKLTGKVNTTIKNSRLDVYTCFFGMDNF